MIKNQTKEIIGKKWDKTCHKQNIKNWNSKIKSKIKNK